VPVVDALGLNVRDIRETVRACAHVCIPDPPPDYLQEFLVLRLRRDNGALADKIARLSPDRCAELFRLLRALQRVGRDE